MFTGKREYEISGLAGHCYFIRGRNTDVYRESKTLHRLSGKLYTIVLVPNTGTQLTTVNDNKYILWKVLFFTTQVCTNIRNTEEAV